VKFGYLPKMEQTLNIALKKEELCIAINRKAEDLPRLTQQDFRALAEHAADVLREERLRKRREP
jgi:hypothetical protein